MDQDGRTRDIASRSTRIRGIEPGDHPEINRIFSEAFTDSYHRDGILGLRIPPLEPRFLALEREVAGDGAFAAESRGKVTGFVLARAHGSEGWIGPLAVDPASQGKGLGKALVRRAIEHLESRGCTAIGLETMPRTYRNLGLYLKLGFRPGHLVLTCQVEIPVQIPKVRGHRHAVLLSHLHASERASIRGPLAAHWSAIAPAIDYEEEIAATLRHEFGDVLVLCEGDRVQGFLHFHHARYFVTDGPGVIRVARLGARREGNAFPILMAALADHAVDRSMNELYVRCQSSDWEVTRQLLAWGFRVSHSDLRMHLDGYAETTSPDYIHLSRWG